VIRALAAVAVLNPCPGRGEDPRPSLVVDFEKEDASLRLVHGARRVEGTRGWVLELTNALQYAEVDPPRSLDGIEGMTAGGWFLPRRSGEQSFFFRGIPEVAPLGERLFRPEERWVNFVVGTDQHGFLLGTINGNGSMPFPLVSLNDVPVGSWSQLVCVKRPDGYQELYRNGVLVHTDRESARGGKAHPFRETDRGEPVRIAMPLGGLVGEAWIHPRALSADEIRSDFEAKRARYHPALPAEPVLEREMDSHPAPDLWKEPIDERRWPGERERILRGLAGVLGPPPAERVPLDPRVISEADCGVYLRRKVSIQVQEGDRMPAWLLVPKRLVEKGGKAPAIICFYGTTSGAGKDTTVGLSGPVPGTPPARNRAFAVDMAEAGFVAFAADYLRDGERVEPGWKPYDSTAFYEKFPAWSIVGKDAWDNSRAIDYLETLDFVDAGKIGMAGHSYGGHSTIFAAALEPRIRAAVASGPVSHFIQYGLHWGRPIGAGGGEYIRGMRPYVLDPTIPIPVSFHEVTALIAPRPLLVFQAVGERRPLEEENHAAVSSVYRALGAGERVRYAWHAGDHDFPPVARRRAVEWFRRWLE
jgi:dienelactone hydrolase